MNHAKSSLLAAGAMLALAGCSTGSQPSATTENGIDQAQVARIEGAAQRHGTRVIWVNMPRKAPAAPAQK